MESIKIWIFVVTLLVFCMSLPLALGGIFIRYYRQRKLREEFAKQQDFINTRLQKLVGDKKKLN